MKRLFILIFLASLLEARSNITNLILTEENSITTNSYIRDATIEQGLINVKNATINNSKFDFTNKIEKSNITNSAYIRQAVISLNQSSIINSNISLTNTITDSRINNATIDQSIIILKENSEIKESNITTINLINKLKTGGRSSVIQAYISMDTGSKINKSKITLDNTVDDTYISNSHIYQAELIMNNGFISGATINNTNKIFNDSDLTDSTLIQGRIEIYSGATLSHNITINSTADKLTMTNSTLSMCGVTINSDSTEDITKTCSISNTTIRDASRVILAGSTYE